MTHPRGLSEDEAAAWEKLAATVTPFEPRRPARQAVAPVARKAGSGHDAARPAPGPSASQSNRPVPQPSPAPGTLDSHRDRRLRKGEVSPDFTLDLHGHGLDAAYRRLMDGVRQARMMDARTILLVTGKPRPVDPADRGTRRGAIRAKVLDWLAASEHSSAIAAIRTAHRRHGGDGALYLVLRRRQAQP